MLQYIPSDSPHNYLMELTLINIDFVCYAYNDIKMQPLNSSFSGRGFFTMTVDMHMFLLTVFYLLSFCQLSTTIIETGMNILNVLHDAELSCKMPCSPCY